MISRSLSGSKAPWTPAQPDSPCRVVVWVKVGKRSARSGGVKVLTTLSPLLRFFLMYLINKDETEHTGQVGGFPWSCQRWGGESHQMLLQRTWSVGCATGSLDPNMFLIPAVPSKPS